jgi:hypothetical protein
MDFGQQMDELSRQQHKRKHPALHIHGGLAAGAQLTTVCTAAAHHFNGEARGKLAAADL